jgi:hypothetical protein
MTLKEAIRNPAIVLGVLGAIITVGAAFGLPVTEVQTHSILVFGGAVSLIFLAKGASTVVTLAPQTLTGMVTAAIGVAIAFGLNITHAQQTDVLNLVGVLSGLLLVHGTAHTVVKGLAAARVAGMSQSVPLAQGFIGEGMKRGSVQGSVAKDPGPPAGLVPGGQVGS